jgi:hypothetical protein
MSELTPDPPPPTKPPTKYDAWAFLIIGILALPVLALGIGALVLPPGISFSLIRRGLAEHRSSWLLLGILTAMLWLFFLWLTGRRIFKRRGTPP